MNPTDIASTLELIIVPSRTLARLNGVDILVIAIYFVAVIYIGFYLKRDANTGEDFFMAGREMTAWVAGLSFVSANLGSLELMGWAGAAYQYGILAAHWYWIGAIPRHALPRHRDDAVLLHLENALGAGLSATCATATARALSAAITFAFMTVLMSGINMYAMAMVMKVVLGWDIHFSIWVSSVTVAVYVALGGLLSAIFNEVLQFFLIWFGALLIPILGLIEAGGWAQPQGAACTSSFHDQRLHAHVEHARALHRQPHGHALDRHRLRALAAL